MEGITLDNEMGSKTGFEIQTREKTHPKELVNGTPYHDVLSKIF